MALLAQKGIIKPEKQVSNFRGYVQPLSGTILHAACCVLMLVSHDLNGANGAPLIVIKIQDQETSQNLTYSNQRYLVWLFISYPFENKN